MEADGRTEWVSLTAKRIRDRDVTCFALAEQNLSTKATSPGTLSCRRLFSQARLPLFLERPFERFEERGLRLNKVAMGLPRLQEAWIHG